MIELDLPILVSVTYYFIRCGALTPGILHESIKCSVLYETKIFLTITTVLA